MRKTLIISTFATFIAVSLLTAAPAEAGAIDKLKNVLRIGGEEPFALPINTVHFADKKTAKKIIVESVSAERTAADGVQVNVRFYNKGKKPMRIAVRSSFFDQQDRLSETPGVWKTVHILPKSFASYAAISMPRHDVAGFIIEVQGYSKGGIF